jgi:hypothetical protein
MTQSRMGIDSGGQYASGVNEYDRPKSSLGYLNSQANRQFGDDPTFLLYGFRLIDSLFL